MGDQGDLDLADFLTAACSACLFTYRTATTTCVSSLLPLFVSACLSWSGSLASQLQHVALDPGMAVCPHRALCLSLCNQLRDAFMEAPS